MSTAFKKALLAAAAFTLVAAGRAEALEPKFGEMYLRLTPCLAPCPFRPTVHVVHEDGQWTRVEEDDVELRLDFGVTMKKGDIVNYRVGRPGRHDSLEQEFPMGFDLDPKLKASNIHERVTVMGPLTPAEKQLIIDKCSNEATAENNFITNQDFIVGLLVDAKRAGDSGRKLVTANIPIKVVCEPLNTQSEAPPQPVSLDIQVKPVSETCPKKTEVTAYVDYDEKTSAHIRAIKQDHVGRAAPWVEAKTREVTLGPKTWHRAEHVFAFDLDPGKHTFRIEVQHGPNSEWKSIDLTCPPFEIVFTSLEYETEEKATCPKLVEEIATFTTNGPGTIDYAITLAGTEWAVRSGSVKAERHGDGYRAVVEHTFPQNAIDKFMTVEATDISGPNDPGPLANASAQMTVTCLEVLSGTLDLRGFAATDCEGEAAFSIRTNQSGEVPYKLNCSGGKTWSGTAQTKQTAPNTFIGVDTKPFDVTNNEYVTCALKTAKPLPAKVLAIKGRKYECHKPADVGGTDDVAPKPRPTEKEPKSVAPEPKPQIACANGTVKDGACLCPRAHRRVRAGENAWRCVKTVVITPPDPVPEKRQIVCANGTVKDGACLCPPAHKRVKAGENAWRCVKTVVIEPPKIPIGCVNGQVKNSTCVCGSTHKRVKIGTNAWRCVKATPQIQTAPLRSTR